jgi:tRNA pseudouridine38-40 synthase
VGEQSQQAVRSATARPEHSQPAGNWKLTLAYDGSSFSGWQVQPGRSTVQGTLAAALERITGERLLPQGSGRTDAGVHALGQVASFRLHAAIPAANLYRALNHALPPSIRVLSAEAAAPDFHARHSARSKLYEYRIWRGELCPPWTAPYVHACPWPLRLDAMMEAAQRVLGEHDFTSFAAREPDLSTRADLTLTNSSLTDSSLTDSSQAEDPAPIAGQAQGSTRRLLLSTWEQRGPDLLCYQVRGTGFLHHMVRNLVGTFLAVGRGQFQPTDLLSILAARNRAAAGPTAPAQGLFLHSVAYCTMDQFEP